MRNPMEKLVLKKKKIEHEINLVTTKETKTQTDMKNLESKICKLESSISKDKAALQQLDIQLNTYTQKITSLKQLTTEYEQDYKSKIKAKYIEKYKSTLEYVKTLKFNNIENVSEMFVNVTSILKKVERFPIFYNKLNLCFIKTKDTIIKKLIKCIDENISDINNIHNASYYITILSDVESVLNENIFVDYCFKAVHDSFSYNFLSEKKTNRMDKPEWFIKLILEKARIEKRKLCIYDNLNRDRHIYALFCDKIKDLIDMKIHEIVESDSLQKRNLLLHFAEEVIKMNNELHQLFEIRIELNDLTNYIIKYEKLFIDKRMEEINQDNYRNWFKNYKLVVDELYLVFSSLSHFDSKIFSQMCQYVLNHIYLYCEVFIKQIRLNSKDELRLLCFLFNEIEIFKHSSAEKMDEYYVSNDIDCTVQFDITNLSQLNNDNFKLIKDMASNEIQVYLKRIKDFIYVSERHITHCIMEIFNMLSDFRKYISIDSSYSILEKYLGEICDDFILTNIILKIRFEESEYETLSKFLNKMCDIFSCYQKWKSKEGAQCIEDVIKGKITNGQKFEFFNVVYENHKENHADSEY